MVGDAQTQPYGAMSTTARQERAIIGQVVGGCGAENTTCIPHGVVTDLLMVLLEKV